MDTDKTQTLRQKLHSSLEGAVRSGNGTATCWGCQIRKWTRPCRLLEPVPVFVYAASAHTKGNVAPFEPGDSGKIHLRTQVASRRTLASVFLSVLCCVAAVSRSVWDGVYTKEQANRGLATYREECLKCHGESLGGGEAGPPLAGEEFLRKWNGKTVGDLSAVIRKTMPLDDPGNLSSREYLDIVAYILSMNEFPTGQKELDRDVAALNEIRIEMKR
jgi:mono/diheme cytochrome c family protein